MLVNRPGKFIIQFPRNDKHQQCTHTHDAWDDDKERFCFWPHFGADSIVDNQNARYSFLDLLNLDGTVDQESNVA